MRNDKRRITLIAQGPGTTERAWDSTAAASTRLLFIESMQVVLHSIDHGIPELSLDIERIVLDRAASAIEYLDLLCGLPLEFSGDVVLIAEDDGGFLSAAGRGGNRVLYALSPSDVDFYLETHALVGVAAEAAMPALVAMPRLIAMSA